MTLERFIHTVQPLIRQRVLVQVFRFYEGMNGLDPTSSLEILQRVFHHLLHSMELDTKQGVNLAGVVRLEVNRRCGVEVGVASRKLRVEAVRDVHYRSLRIVSASP